MAAVHNPNESLNLAKCPNFGALRGHLEALECQNIEVFILFKHYRDLDSYGDLWSQESMDWMEVITLVLLFAEHTRFILCGLQERQREGGDTETERDYMS